MDLDGIVLAYNAVEARFAGVSPDRALGLTFFTDIAPCTNNYLVAGRFDEEPELDETIDYVFSVRMRPTSVRLRLLKNERAGRQYIAVEW
jgi:photoactive yellow protein